MYHNNKVLLLILDGWGLGQVPESDAIRLANPPFFNHLIKNYPSTTLTTFGEQVGLPEGQMGNSEVGHLNIGAGRVVYQDFLRINNAVKDQSIFKNERLLACASYCISNDEPLHLMGLVSDGGVHSHINHLLALCDFFNKKGVQTYIHAFTDGRDTDPKSGLKYLTTLTQHIENLDFVKLASVIGRFYAMDRDKRWERVKKAYDLLVKGEGVPSKNVLQTIEDFYKKGVTDEFLEPIICVNDEGKPFTKISENNAVFCFNFRTDRCREITTVLTQQDMPDYEMTTLPLNYHTMTMYDENFEGVKVIFDNKNLKNTLGEVLERHKKTQLRAAETEKYPHVTFFFSGGREEPYEGESRVLVPSPKVKTYDLQPEMSAPELAEKVANFIDKNQPNFVCLNFANPDMVGHTGVLEAVKKAIEATDNCTEKVVKTALNHNYTCIIIADHGNADFMINDDGSPHTAHTTNLVPMIVVDNHFAPQLKKGKLGDIAPTILKIMNIPQPTEMDGEVLV